MSKLLVILLIGLMFESTGIVLLKKGMTDIGEVHAINAREIFRILKAGVTSPQILLGIFFQALFFACLLVLMSKSDISFLWPLTSLSFVFATLAATLFLGEHVSTIRWAGVLLIVFGAGLISYSEKAKSQIPLPTPTTPAPANEK